jgi:hypothetical protein
LQREPWKDSKPHRYALGTKKPSHNSPRGGGELAVDDVGQGRATSYDWAYPCSIEVLGSTGEVAGEWRRWSSGNTVAAAQIPAKGEARLGNVRHGKLQRDLGKVLGWLKGAWSERSSERVGGCSVATARTRAPTSKQFGQGNKCACRL